MTIADALDLSGRWELTDETGEYSCPVTFPGDGITALYQAGLIPDPYWGRNEYDLRWIADREWSARRKVTLDRTDVELLVDGLDTVCTVKVNGVTVLETRNVHRSYRADLAQAARPGENDFEIIFHSATAAANAAQAAQPFYVPYIAGNNPIPNGNMLRKVACDFGWDWNIALAPFGLTGRMQVVMPAPRVERLRVDQTHRDGRAFVRVGALYDDRRHDVESYRAEILPFTLSLCGQTISGSSKAGEIDVTFEIMDPELWWPAGMGAPRLHDLTVTIGTATMTRRIGLRQIELVSEKDAAGLSFKFRVNGRDVFAKGANWIPADALAGRITAAKTRDLLQSAVDANMNMIRVWGGGRYEPDSFYDACDELGLMVWQDFMFSCNLYPSTPEFLKEVRSEVRQQVRRLREHACIALWCGDNELIGALTWYEESRKDRDRYLVSYDRLNHTIETALKFVDPTANWWPSSPSIGPMDFRDAWHVDGWGDMHFWSVWHEGRDFDHYRDVSPRFCSEFGFQSYPSMNIIRTFTNPGDHNIAAPVFESHQKNKGGNARIAETMFRYFRWPEKFEDFVWLSQIQQGLAIRTAVTHWRTLKPFCMGALYWQLNDTWPVCSWSSLDYGGGWKALHHMAKDFFAPVLVTLRPENGGWSVIAVNDRPDPVRITFQCALIGPDGRAAAGAPVFDPITAEVGAEPMVLLHIPDGDFAPDRLLSYIWTGEDGEILGRDIHSPRPWKDYDLSDPGLTLRAEDQGGGLWQLTLNTRTAAFFASVEAHQPGRMSEGPQHLTAGDFRTFTFRADDPTVRPEFTLRDLWSATVART